MFAGEEEVGEVAEAAAPRRGRERTEVVGRPALKEDVAETEERGAGEASAWTARNRRLEKALVGKGEQTLDADVDDEEGDAVAANRGPAASAEGAVQERMSARAKLCADWTTK